MRILYVAAYLPYGTTEAFLVEEIRQLIRLGHKILLVPRSPRHPLVHGKDLLPYACVESLCSLDVIRRAATASPFSAAAMALRTVLAGSSPAMFCKNVAVIPKALWLADVAAEWDADHIHCHWAGTTATMAMLASRISGIPWSLTAHRWDIVENNLLVRKVASASFVRFISADGFQMARSIGIGAANNVRVLPMGVPVPENVRYHPGPRPVLLCPARLAEVKGHGVLLHAWRDLKRCGIAGELWLAGDGEKRSDLEALTHNLGMSDSVKFLGSVPHADILRWYEQGAISAVVLASLDLGGGHHEGIPVALIEAMSYGVPVVATAAGGTIELVTPGCGLLVAPGDAPSLADAIRTLLQNSELSRRLGHAGRERVKRDYNIVSIASALVREFESAARTATPVVLPLS